MAALSTSAAAMIAEIRCIKIPERERTRANSYFARCKVSKKSDGCIVTHHTGAKTAPAAQGEHPSRQSSRDEACSGRKAQYR